MKYLTPAILAATFALSSGAVFAADPAGTDSTTSASQSMKDCMAAQEAKNPSASHDAIKQTCKDAERTDSKSKSSATDSQPYGGTAPSSSSSAPPQSSTPR
jgi:hypothetical protein